MSAGGLNAYFNLLTLTFHFYSLHVCYDCDTNKTGQRQRRTTIKFWYDIAFSVYCAPASLPHQPHKPFYVNAFLSKTMLKLCENNFNYQAVWKVCRMVSSVFLPWIYAKRKQNKKNCTNERALGWRKIHAKAFQYHICSFPFYLTFVWSNMENIFISLEAVECWTKKVSIFDGISSNEGNILMAHRGKGTSTNIESIYQSATKYLDVYSSKHKIHTWNSMNVENGKVASTRTTTTTKKNSYRLKIDVKLKHFFDLENYFNVRCRSGCLKICRFLCRLYTFNMKFMYWICMCIKPSMRCINAYKLNLYILILILSLHNFFRYTAECKCHCSYSCGCVCWISAGLPSSAKKNLTKNRQQNPSVSNAHGARGSTYRMCFLWECTVPT